MTEVTFEALGLPASILANLTKIGFTTPTPIQAQSIPVTLAGHDVLGSAQTGTGKTAAFGLPMLAHLLKNPLSRGIIMTPTRELAAQVLKTLLPLLPRDFNTALLIGGDSMGKQMSQLQRKPRIIVGTPGRINDHLERRSLDLRLADFLVLDETDRMLDMGFGIQIDRILKHMPKERQTLLFSATIPREIENLAQKYQKDPVRISVGSVNATATNIKQEQLRMVEGEKYTRLIEQLTSRQGSIIVFVKTKFGAKRMAEKLAKEGHKADAIHGNLNQNKRDRVIQAFRDKRYRILVATDVAARGLDIPHIETVINYDLPQAAEDYIHRIGRTARNGAEGTAVAFITPSDGRLWNAIHKLLNPGDKTPMQREERGASSRPQQKHRFRQRREGGFRSERSEGGQRREGGYERREGGQRREGGFQRREAGAGGQRREGGYSQERREGGQRREGGFRSERSEGGQRREGGYERREGGQRREGGFQRREAGAGGQRREGGYSQERREGGQQRRWR